MQKKKKNVIEELAMKSGLLHFKFCLQSGQRN